MNTDNSEKIDALMCLLMLIERVAKKEQKDNVGIAFITNVLKLDEQLAEEFAYGHDYAWQVVGHKQKEGIPEDVDCSNFWKRVSGIFPNYFSERDVEILSDLGVSLIMQFKCHLNVKEPKSTVLTTIETSRFSVE